MFWRSGNWWRLAARAALRDRMRLCGQFLWASISVADRDLVFQDFLLVLVPGMRLSCLARAAARGVRRFARTGSRRLAHARARGVRRFARTGACDRPRARKSKFEFKHGSRVPRGAWLDSERPALTQTRM